MTKIEEFLQLVKENPDLPIVPMVDSEIVADDCCTWWMGKWGESKVTGTDDEFAEWLRHQIIS